MRQVDRRHRRLRDRMSANVRDHADDRAQPAEGLAVVHHELAPDGILIAKAPDAKARLTITAPPVGATDAVS